MVVESAAGQSSKRDLHNGAFCQRASVSAWRRTGMAKSVLAQGHSQCGEVYDVVRTGNCVLTVSPSHEYS